MNLMIIESPGKAKKLREILMNIHPNEKWNIQASVGHVRDLPAKGQGDDEITTGVRKDFRPIYQLTDRGSEVVSKIKKAAAQASTVYLATDPDREGESISWHLKEALGLKNYIRVSFNEISEQKVREALSNPGQIDIKLVAAQEARRVLDRLVGYRVSSELRRQTGEVLSAGRVQSPAVYLVVLRERAIKAFKPTTHFSARIIFAGEKKGEQWEAEWITEEGFVTEESPYFMDKLFAEKVASIRDTRITSFEESEKLRNPPAPFTTSTLQQAASNALKINPDTAMKIAQSLYEQGHISYHRTDNPNVSEEAMPDIRAVAEALGHEVMPARRKFKAKDGAQEGHPAITPTDWRVESAGETAQEQALYSLIRIRALASQLMPARYSVRTVYLQAAEPLDGKQIVFGATGRTLQAPGWLKLLADDATEDDKEEEKNNPIPALEANTAITASDGALIERTTKAPKRYTEASLVRALESEGVGRPATFASIMNNIIGRGYVALDKRFLKPQPLGELVISKLENNFSFLDIGFTKDMENMLDQIAEGETQYTPVIAHLNATLDAELGSQASVPSTTKTAEVYPCPACSKPLRRIAKGAHGAFWGCTGYPECKESLPDAKGKPGKKKQIQLSEFNCPQCSKPLIHRVRKGKGGYDFWGCSGFTAGCKTAFKNKDNKPVFT